MRCSGLTRVPAAAMSTPSAVRMSRATVMAGSHSRLRSLVAGAMPGAGSGSSSFRRALARASCSSRASAPERSISIRRASICASRSGSATGQVAPRTPRSFADTAPGRAAASSRAAPSIVGNARLIAPPPTWCASSCATSGASSATTRQAPPTYSTSAASDTAWPNRGADERQQPRARQATLHRPEKDTWIRPLRKDWRRTYPSGLDRLF